VCRCYSLINAYLRYYCLDLARSDRLKYYCIIFCLLLYPCIVFAQDEPEVKELVDEQLVLSNQSSLIDLSRHNLGGYGGPHFKLTNINGEFALIGGGPLAVAVNPKLSIFGTFNYLEADVNGIEMAYGGIGAEYALFPEKRFQVYFSGQAGAGIIDYSTDESSYQSGVIVLEPEMLFGIKIGEFEKVKLGMGYRFAAGIKDLPGLNYSDFSGLYGKVELSYGIFDQQKRKEFLENKESFNILSGTYSLKFSSLNHQFILLDGGGTRFIINRRYAVGISGYRALRTADYRGNELSTGYGGVWNHYIISPMSKVHVSISLLTAIGGIGYTDAFTDEFVSKTMLVLEPDLFMDVNMTEFMRMGLGLGFRLMPGSFGQLNTWDMSSLTGTVQVRFGGF